MIIINSALKKLEQEGNPIRVGMKVAGYMAGVLPFESKIM